MTLDVRMREAADALDTPRMQVPSFEHIRRRRNRLRWRAGLLGMLALALPVGAAISLGSGNDSPRIVANPKPVTPRARTTDALGLAVQLPSGWLLQSGSCPAALTVTVIETVKPLPVPAGCPPVDDPWAVVQRVPTDLDGIDRACGPGFIDDMPSCQAIERGSPGSSTIGTERRFYAGLDVLVSIHRTQAAGPSDVELKFSYSDPAQAEAYRADVYQFPQPLDIARRAVERVLQGGCIALGSDATQSAVDECDALGIPGGGAVREVESGSAGGAVPGEYWFVSVASGDALVRYRLLVEFRWDPSTRGLRDVITSMTIYGGPWPQVACVAPPTDPRFFSHSQDCLPARDARRR